MKKNSKFRGNGGNSNAYSLNYKFDSISPAGKVSGTALDLIKRYNELAKEAHGSGDYIEMEIYRQYAEHYRKIVTEINERKNARAENAPAAITQNDNKTQDDLQENTATKSIGENPQTSETFENSSTIVAEQKKTSEKTLKTTPKKAFKVIEVQPQAEADVANESNDKPLAENITVVKRKRCYRRKPAVESSVVEATTAII